MRVGTRKVKTKGDIKFEDHPHACGDKFALLYTDVQCLGSSPCVWGQACCKYNFNPILRIIPMRVGTSEVWAYAWCRLGDHPHACGDKQPENNGYVPDEGSSPCVWGQADFAKFLIDRFRIIPMRVGTSSHNLLNPVVTEDHPHACGDKFIIRSLFVVSLGSSPCVWGQEHFHLHISRWHRIIPMRVGTSYLTNIVYDGREDHPHACGDKPHISKHLTVRVGSSPCVWGQDNDVYCHGAGRGIIPMRVGTSFRCMEHV